MTDEPESPEGGEDDFDLRELIDDYIEGARDNIKGINDGLMALEKNPADIETLFDVFRRAHGMKGSSNMIGFTDIGEVTHHLEDFLKNFYENKVPLDSSAVDVALEVMDTVTTLLEGKKENQEFTVDIAPAIALMEHYGTGAPPAPPAEASATPATAPAAETAAAAEPAKAAPAAPHPTPAAEIADSIRIRVEKADELMMLTGNLLSGKFAIADELGRLGKFALGRRITRQQMIDFQREMHTAADLMSRAVDEMRTAVIGIRMLPVSTLFNPFPRLVRDLSRKLKKKVEFIMTGGEILLDRKIIDEMNEPLIHMIRNSLDHGFEDAEERSQTGKNPTATLTLSARSERGKIYITIEDDGRGIDPDRVKKKAVEKGLITAERAETMTKVEAQMLVFAPGFSTKEAATDVSGRGVGMDAVKNAVEKLQGVVEVDSDTGRGTKSTIILPLTIASTKILLMEVGGQTIGLPAAYVTAVTHLEDELIPEDTQGATMEFQGKTLPLFLLDETVAKRGRIHRGKWYVLIVEAGVYEAAFAVSELYAQREAVIKELPKNIRQWDLWIGAAQSSSGDLIPMLNIHAALRACGL